MVHAAPDTAATAHPAAILLADAVDKAIGVLTHDALVGLGPGDLLATLHSVERLRNQLQVIDHELVAAADTIDLADHNGVSTLPRFLEAALRIERGDAAARVAAATTLRPTLTMTGDTLPALRPKVADAVRTGTVNSSHIAIIGKALSGLEEHGATPADLVQAEKELVEHAAVFTPTELRRIAHRLVELFNPDGTLADEAGHEARRRVSLIQSKDGSFKLDGRLTPTAGELLKTVLEPLSKPHDGPEGRDLRDIRERTHDALADMAERLLRGDEVPDTGGIPATVVINVDLDTLTNGTTAADSDVPATRPMGEDETPSNGARMPARPSRNGSGTFADGTPISLRALFTLADQAEIVFVFRDSLTGAVLDLGRTKRCASRDQTLALYARDRGCSFPGCDRAPSWCQRHHVIAWYAGGLTDIDNLTLLCSFHHHNFERLGWQCRMRNGIPEWTPPRYIDPARTPMINKRIRPPALLVPDIPDRDILDTGTSGALTPS